MLRRRPASSAHPTLNHPPGGQRKQGPKTCGFGFFIILLLATCLLLTPVILLYYSLTHHSHTHQEQLRHAADTVQEQHQQKHHVPPVMDHVYHYPNDDTKYYTIFSTDCSEKHIWQSYVFFYWAKKVGQPGTIVRIASGCTAKQEKELEDYHFHHIESTMSGRFKLHFTPDYGFSDGPDEPYFPYYNKPFGVRHWMEKRLGFPNNEDDDDAVIILMDPDMMLTRPLTRYFDNKVDRWHNETSKDKSSSTYWKVDHGKPVAQKYGLRDIWTSWEQLPDIVGHDSPALKVSSRKALDHYQLGPPYLATARDMYKIVAKWSDIVVKVHEVFPNMLAEMEGFIVAAADLNLPHQMSYSFMYSDSRTDYEEPWDWVESLDKNRLCDGTILDETNGMTAMPYVLHYCQKYTFRDYFFYKYRLKGKINKCSHALLEEPVLHAHDFDWTTHHAKLEDRRKENRTKWAVRTNQREAFMTCQVTYRLNEAMEHHRLHTCHHHVAGRTVPVNVDKTFRLVDS